MTASIASRFAERLRRAFDLVPPRFGAASVAGLFAALTAFTGYEQGRLLERDCGPLPVSLIRVEVTFSASRFAALLNAEGKCRDNVIASLVTWDAVFPLAYALLMCALFLWAERWRRFTPDGVRRRTPPRLQRDIILLAPLAAAVLDIVAENLPLWFAGRLFGSVPPVEPSVLVAALVILGSSGALIKWLLILLGTMGILLELLAGPRGSLLWRVRFSVLAVLVGGVPLLAIPQGQDILQRVFEGEHPGWRLLAAVPPLVFGAVAVWYAARALTELRLGAGAERWTAGDAAWYEFFGEQIPRTLGIILVGLVGLAFAAAGLAASRYIVVGIGAVFAALLTRRFFSSRFTAIGRLLVPPRWQTLPGLDERVARVIVAAAAGVFIFWPHVLPMEGDTPFVFGGPDTENESTLFYLRVAAYLCFVSAWLLHLYVRLVDRDAEAPSARPALDSIDAGAVGLALKRRVVVAGLVSLGFLAAFTAAPVGVGRAIGPLWILTLATVNAVFIGSLTVWAGRRLGIPIVSLALLLALLFSLWNDNHRVRLLDEALTAREPADLRFERWASELRRGRTDSRLPVVLAAGAGGGLRAAYWTAMSLAVLQDRNPGFARQMFAFSGVSGGSLGGMLFAAAARDADADGRPRCRQMARDERQPAAVGGPYASCIASFMSDDHLSPVLAKLVAPDFLQWFLPFPVFAFDRSSALERSWERSYQNTMENRGTFALGFAAFANDQARSSIVPLIVLNSTHVETGRRYVASTVPVEPPAGIAALHDAGDILAVLDRDIPVSTAIHNSARFTYISPAGHLDAGDGIEHGRVVDGGYFENSGLASLREVYDTLRTADANVDLYVLYLCNDPVSCNEADRKSDETSAFPSTAADELLSPVRALYRTRDARGSLARASLRSLAGDRFFQLNVCDERPPRSPAESARMEKARDRIVSPPLGWLLSKLARDWMDASLAYTRPGKDGNCYERNAHVIDALSRALATP